ncbi:DUF2158 domain-containing protein [Vibrio parahaemolyticus]|nr:DUF2158 domain-containing protein [Vibrio parahaemolyticus]NWK16434.1 DUF2158 domain-containing protein [Vibrio parahaemolyticus]
MMMFEVGDVVTLKSGSPEMTVVGLDFGGNLICNWFDSKQELKSGSFPSASLESCDED